MAKYDFFISYSTKDIASLRLCNSLENAGVSCWIAPRNIRPGTPYAKAIMQGIEESDTFIVCISTNSIISEDVLNEIDNAHRLKKTIIPVFIEPTHLNQELSYYLNRKQWVNLYDGEQQAINLILGHKVSSSSNKQDKISRSQLSLPPFDENHLFEALNNKPSNSSHDNFLFPVEDVFGIKGRGVVVTGKIESGSITVGDSVTIIGEEKQTTAVVIGVEMKRKLIDKAIVGDVCGLLLRGVSDMNVIKRGYVLYNGPTKYTSKIIKVGVRILTPQAGSTHRVRLSIGDQITIYNRTNDMKGRITRQSQIEATNGDFVGMEIELERKIFIQPNDIISLRHNDETIGCGMVYR